MFVSHHKVVTPSSYFIIHKNSLSSQYNRQLPHITEVAIILNTLFSLFSCLEIGIPLILIWLFVVW